MNYMASREGSLWMGSPVRFFLNHSNANKQAGEHSVFVGDLDASVDDEMLYKAFASRYSSVRLAKVVREKETGASRGYAFVRFAAQADYKDALGHMNGFTGLGSKPIRVSQAVPKQHTASANSEGGADNSASAAADDYTAYYEQYWQNYNAWQNYASYDPNGANVASCS
ncbi:tRNA selenocysteine 1-associated protein 1-like [Pollicipes pollicipes]|uniref:tRNA selenocysteine 1-associated protein 1-like n=1 Tax=Pollicipes pollicipes TaxID=41117 RepID=UPI001885071D|nr:tRNA selenocysteine 1-associated protein 1-like [Pollicipes pollicipes]